MPATDHIPSFQDIEKKYITQWKKSRAILYSLISANFALYLTVVWIGRLDIITYISIVSFLGFILYLKQRVLFLFLRKIRLTKNCELDTGPYNGRSLYNEIESLFLESNKTEVPAIYIIETKCEGPFVIDTYFFNFIKPWNAIYIPEYLLHILKLNELKAVIAHELGHFYHYIFPVNRFPLPLTIFSLIYPSLLFFSSSIPVSGIVFTSILSFIITDTTHNHWTSKNSIPLEYLSDIYAAKKIGKLNHINALITIGRYFEIIETLHKIVSNNTGLTRYTHPKSRQKIIHQILSSHSINENFNIEDYIKRIPQGPVSQKTKGTLSKLQIPSSDETIKAYLKSIGKNRSNLDWDSFDVVVKNKRIEHTEYKLLIQEITNNPDKFLIDSIIDGREKTIADSHPRLRDRILFLHKHIH